MRLFKSGYPLSRPRLCKVSGQGWRTASDVWTHHDDSRILKKQGGKLRTLRRVRVLDLQEEKSRRIKYLRLL